MIVDNGLLAMEVESVLLLLLRPQKNHNLLYVYQIKLILISHKQLNKLMVFVGEQNNLIAHQFVSMKYRI
jgi:hypothetical protein